MRRHDSTAVGGSLGGQPSAASIRKPMARTQWEDLLCVASSTSYRRHNPNRSGDRTCVLDQCRGKISAPKRLGQASAELREAQSSHNSANSTGDQASECTAACKAERGAAKRTAHDPGEESGGCLAARRVRQLVDD